jgi:hypothetical protein
VEQACQGTTGRKARSALRKAARNMQPDWIMAALLLAGTSIPPGSCRFRWRTTAPDIDAGGWTRESDAAAVAERRLDIIAVARWFATFIKRFLEMP